jgi:hypothetical protein
VKGYSSNSYPAPQDFAFVCALYSAVVLFSFLGANMSTAEQDIANFANFALQRIESGQRDATIDELFDQWRLENPSADQSGVD